MSLIPENCIHYCDNRNECIASEKGKTFRLINRSGYKVKKVKIDQCFPQKQGEKRCDYLMSIDEPGFKSAFFIELKGGGLVYALKQIYDSIIYLKAELKGFQLQARIVGSGDVPGFNNTPHYIKLKKEIYPTKGTIERSTNKIYSEII